MSWVRVCVIGRSQNVPLAACIFTSYTAIKTDVPAKAVDALTARRTQFREPELGMILVAPIQTGGGTAGSIRTKVDKRVVAVAPSFGRERMPDPANLDAAGESLAPLLKAGQMALDAGLIDEIGLMSRASN